MKNILSVAVLVLSLNCTSQITTTGLVRYFPFSGNANDTSVSAQHGTVYGATLTTDRFGVPNSAYAFNGVSDYIEMPVTGLLLNEYTYTAWAWADSVPPPDAARLVLSVGTNALSNPSGGDQVLACNNMSIVAYNGWGGNGYNIPASPKQLITYHGATVIPNQWTHLAMTRSYNVLKFYLNCVLEKTDSTLTLVSPSYGNAPAAKIGCRQNGTMFFQGKIDEVRIYDRVLTDNEIQMMCREQPMFIVPADRLQAMIFPNPAEHEIYIRLPQDIQKAVFELTDIRGRTLISRELTETSVIATTDLQPGVYFYQLTSGQYKQTGKLVRE